MQRQIALLAAMVAACHCTHSSCPLDLRDPCASAATQAHDGDIAIPVIPGHPNSSNASESREKRAATSFTSRLWPGAVVYYTMSNSFSSFHRQLIYMAMHHWESHTCIRFHPRTTQHSYVNFFPGSRCCSYIGWYNCGLQGISLGQGCISVRNAIHEIGHAVGFWHEQSRPDRDQYVNVLWNNVRDGYERNFRKLPPSEINSLGVGYDYNSIMHYPPNFWSKSRNLDTIQPKVPGIQIGTGHGLSPLDIEQANRLYRCDLATVIPPHPTPPTESFPCGDMIVASSGSFHSPGYYDFDYRTNQDCTWVLKGPENHRLTITFNMIRMEDSPGCSKDYLTVTLPETLNTQAFNFSKICNQETSYNLHTSGNVATVYYHTDGNNRGTNLRGFEAIFQSVDINECALGNGGCEHKCVNSAGSFRCECNPGFVLLSNGKQCEDGPCHNNNAGCEQLCFEPSSPSGSPTCGCREGYRLAANAIHCLDIDECTEGSHSCQHNCSNLHGSYSCSCRAGYQLNHNGNICNNIDECVLGRDSCTHNCRDTDGSYECGCPNGLRLADNSHVCEDIDECEEGSARCSHGCRNTVGSYQCFCPLGFHIDSDGATCVDQNECSSSSSNACKQQSGAFCVNTVGSYQCTCGSGYLLESTGISCQEHLNMSISVHYTYLDDFTLSPKDYKAASGPVTVTCIATGPERGVIHYQWSSTCRNCPFQSTTLRSIVRSAVHSGDNGTHTCTATRGRSTASASIDFYVVGAGVHIFRGSPRGNFPPNNGLVVSDNPARGDFRFRIFCRSDSVSENIGEFIGLDGATVLTSNSFFAISRLQPGELRIENTVGSQSSLTASQQGVYTCRIPLYSGAMREFNIGVYPSGFNISPVIFALTSGSSSATSLPILTCTSTGSPATTVTWERDGKTLTVNGSTYQMVQTVTNRPMATYENVLTINQSLADIVGSNFTCTVINVLGSDTSGSLHITGFGPVNECETDNGGCAHICTDSPTSYHCSCRSGYRMQTNCRRCDDIDECSTNNGGCAQICTNTPGSRECSCSPGFILNNDSTGCTEHLDMSISVDYTPPEDFIPGPNEYRAASGPVTVTCTATGVKSEPVSYQWSSTCRSCPFQSATSNSIKRAAVHSGDNGTHTCVATRGESTTSARIDFHVVDAGVYIFRGSPRGNFPANNGLVISDNYHFRFRIFCRSNSISETVGEFIGLDGTTALTSNDFFAISRSQPGELVVENTVGSQKALTTHQQGVYICRIPLQSGMVREINVGVYPSGFNTPPNIIALTVQLLNSFPNLICTSTGSPATNVTWTRDGQPLTIDESTYQMVQIVVNRNNCTYENVLTINQTLASTVGSTFICGVSNVIGSDTSDSLQITGFGLVNECETNNGGCEHICTDTATSFQCSCRSGYRLATDHRMCNAVRSCEFRNGGCVHECFYDVDGIARCKCKPGYIQHRVYGRRCFAFDDPRSSKGDCGLPCDDICVREGDSFRCDCSEVGKFLQSDGISCRTTQPITQAPTTQLTAHTPKTEQPTTQYIAIQPTTHVPSIMPTAKVVIIQPASQVPITPQPTTQPPMIQLTAAQRTPASIQSTAQASFPEPTTQVPAIQPTTQAPTTIHPTTSHPSTQPNPTQPTTEAPTTQPTTEAPTTQPTTDAPTTQPTTDAPTTQSTTEVLTTQPTPEMPTTQPMTEMPMQPTTEAPTTQPTTEIPTTQPTTEMPTTQPTTEMPTTHPTTEMPTTQPTIQTEPTPMIDCVRDITASAGVIQSPNWPETYPSSVYCEWTITVPDANGAVQLNFDPIYGIKGVPPSCEEDWLEVLNGPDENTVPQTHSCGNISPSTMILSINTAKVVFTSGPQHDSSHQGFRINFHTVERPLGTFSCGQFIGINQYFGPPDFPHPIGHTVSTSLLTNVKCTWRCLATIGLKIKLRLLYFDLPESEGCSQNSLKIYDGLFERNIKVANLCGSPTKQVYHVSGAYMTVVLETTTPGTFRGFHAVCEV